MMAYHEILSAIHCGHVQNSHAVLWSRKISAIPEQQIFGSVPIIFNSSGENLTGYRIYGNSGGVGIYDAESDSFQIPVKMTAGTETVTIGVYVGSEPLYADEYVSFSEQKIYRKINNVLIPFAPPVPLPALPTLSGTNTLSAETERQPSEVYLKGKIKSLAVSALTDSQNQMLISSNNYQLVTKE